MTDAKRRAKADQKKREQGLIRVSVWVPIEKKKEIMETANRFVRTKKDQLKLAKI